MLDGICSLRVLKFLGLAVGLAAKFTTGSIFIFNAYQDAIKHTFNYTQTEVELLSSMLNVGLGVGFLPGMFYDRFGPTLASTAGLIVSVPVYLLLWSTPRYAQFYSTRAWLMSIYFMLAGIGAVFTYTIALNTNVINFSAKHTGKIVGLLNAFFAGSPSVYGTIYYKLFTTGDPTEPSHQDFGGFMMFFAVMYGTVDILCIVFLRKYPKEDNTPQNKDDNYCKRLGETDECRSLDDYQPKNYCSDREEKEQDISEMASNVPHSLRQTLLNADFQIFMWMFGFASSVSLVYGNNITVTSKSIGLDYYNDKLVIIIPITNALVSASVGVLSDRLKERVPRLVFVLIGICCYIIAQAIVLCFGENLAWFVVGTVFTGAGVALTWSLCPTITKEWFSVEHLGRNWGFVIFVSALVGFGAQLVFGKLYDEHTKETGDHFCYGKVCIQTGYAVFLGVAVLSLILGLLLLLRKRCCYRNTERS